MPQLTVNYGDLKRISLDILKRLQHPTGLFSASKKNVKTGYDLAWMRDNVYISLALEVVNDVVPLKQLHMALLDILLKCEHKIDYAINKKPKYTHQYIHARFHPITKEEIKGKWGNKQNDAIGALLFKIADLEEKGIKILRDENDKRILQKLVYYLQSIEYWHDKDNGMWEENEEIHASSIGACVAGLKKVSKVVHVPPDLIKKGMEALNKILPNESETKESDMALLSLIYPYNIVNELQRKQILDNIEKNLSKEKGVIRYIGDKYYNKNGEAEWTMGLPWLAIIYKNIGLEDKYHFFIERAIKAMNGENELPELYFAASNKHNENSPLGWAQALFLVSVTVDHKVNN